MKNFSILAAFTLIIGFGKVTAQSSIPAAQSVFIYNFTRLTEWPSEYKHGDFVIGVIGSSEVFNELKTYTSGKMVGAQPIKIEKYNSPAEISKCHILFVGFGKTKDLQAIVSKLGGGSTLIVSENRGAIEKGAAINFVSIEDKLKFELKMSNASEVGLKIHSNLENMAYARL